jgi:hypothetical protein
VKTQADIFMAPDRERFMEAMVEVCVERGFAATRVEELCERSGLPAAKFEELFGVSAGLEECMLAAENAIIGDVVSAVSGSYSADRSEWDSGILGMRAILEYMAANPSKAHFGYLSARYAAPVRVREAQESARQVLATMIDRLRENSEAAPAPPKAARAALGSADLVVRREILAGRTERLPRLLPDLVYGATVPFLGQEEALARAARARVLLKGTPWE